MNIVPDNRYLWKTKTDIQVINILGISLDWDNFVEWTLFLEVDNNVKITKDMLKADDP